MRNGCRRRRGPAWEQHVSPVPVKARRYGQLDETNLAIEALIMMNNSDLMGAGSETMV